MKYPKIIPFILKILISILVLTYIFTKQDFHKIVLAIKEVNVVIVILALLLSLISLIILTLKWKIFLERKIKTMFKESFLVFWASNFANLFGLGAIGGETYKVFIFGKKRVLLTSIADKIYSFIWYILFAIAIILTQINNSKIVIFGELSILILIFFVLIWIFSLPKNKINCLLDFKETPSKNFRLYFMHAIYSLLYLLNLTIVYFLIFFSLGISVSLSSLFILIPIMITAITLPISFQGLGVREFLFIKFAQFSGLDPEKALVVSLIGYIFMLINNLLGTIPFLIVKRKKHHFQ